MMGQRRGIARPAVLTSTFAIAAVAVVMGTLILLGATDPLVALRALWDGSVGSSYALFSATLVRATPLLLTGGAIALAFRAGALNIGAEGQLLVGAAAATAVVQLGARQVGLLVLPLGVVAAAGAGAAWAGIAAEMRRRFGVLEVISTILLNFVALYLVGWLVRGPLQEPLRIYPQSEVLPDVGRLPLLIPGSRLHVGFVLALACALLLWIVLERTALGFRVRATGLRMEAAQTAGGIDTAKTVAGAMLASGALAGLAGAVEVQGVTFALYENISPGYGYTAIAVALLARLNPLLIIPSALLFGALEAGAASMQRNAGVPATVATVVEATLILLLLAASRLRIRTAAPA